MSTRRNLLFLAGPGALNHIRERGLKPDDVRLMFGAAGGPKWLTLAEMDRFLFGSWLPRRSTPLHLLGSSIGAWRFTTYCTADPLLSLGHFLDSYVDGQEYDEKPTPKEISDTTQAVMDRFITDEAVSEILAHPHFRLHIMTVRCRHLTRGEKRSRLGLGLALSALSNTVSRKSLHLFYKRALFHHPAGMGPFYEPDTYMDRIPLSLENLRPALTASGAIPVVMEGVRQIPGAPRGTYRDGGIVDYHFDIPTHVAADEIVLYPHFTRRVVPGWFDKKLTWRKPDPAHMDRVLLIAPGDEFIARLPHGKIPDRTDFEYYAGRNKARATYWHAVLGETEALRDELQEALEGGKLAEWVQPWPGGGA